MLCGAVLCIVDRLLICRMAEGQNTVAIIPLNGQNYGTWKVQAKMGHSSGNRGGTG